MKLFVIVAIFVWFICGLAGSWMLEGSQDMHWKTVARGPISLIRGFNEDPVTVPGQ